MGCLELQFAYLNMPLPHWEYECAPGWLWMEMVCVSSEPELLNVRLGDEYSEFEMVQFVSGHK